MTPGHVADRLGRRKRLMIGGRGRVRLQAGAWGVALLVAIAVSGASLASAASGVELVLGKQRPSTPAPSADAAEGAAAEGAGDAPNATKATLTGVPQVDYVHDPNLPRELNGYNLSAYPFYDRVPEDMEFACDGLHDGFYASVPHKCQVYHHCLFGTRYDFLCANYTAFDQKTFICHFVSEVDCENSPKYFSRNEALYKATTTSTAAPPSRPAPPSGGRRGGGRGGGGRRRPAGGRGRPFYDYEYDDQDYDDYDEGGGRRAQGVASEAPLPAAPPRAVFERPRVAPKVRRPVPLSERDKYEYSGTTPAAPQAPPPPALDVPEGARPPPDGDRERPKATDGSYVARSRPEPRPPGEPRERPDTAYSRRPLDPGYGRHREAYRPPSAYSRERPRERRPYRRRPSEEEDDYYYYYDGEEDEDEYRRRRPAARPRARPRPRRPPPRYRDDYEDDEYEDEEDGEYTRPVPALRPAYVTAPGGSSRRARPRAPPPPPPPPRRPNRHSTRYADEDDYYYDEDEEVVEPASRPLQQQPGGAQRRRGRPTGPAAPASTVPPTTRRRYPDDSLEDDGPSAPARRGPVATPPRSSTSTPTTVTSAPPAALRGKLVEVRRHPLRNNPSSSSPSPSATETLPETLRSRLGPRPPEEHDVNQDLNQDLKLKWHPEPIPDVKQPHKYDFLSPLDFDYDSESWAHYESRLREGPVDLLRTRDPPDSDLRQRFESRNPSRGDSDSTRPDSDSRQRYDSRNPIKPQNNQYSSTPKSSVRTPLEEEATYESRSKFSARGELDTRPSKLPPRSSASEVKSAPTRSGVSSPAVEESIVWDPRQRFEGRTAGKYALRPQTSSPVPELESPAPEAEDARPSTAEETEEAPLPAAPERFAGKFLSRPQSSDPFSKYNNRHQQSPAPPAVDVPQPTPTEPLPVNRQPELPKNNSEGNKFSFGRGEPVKTRLIQLTKSVSPQIPSRIPDSPKFVQKVSPSQAAGRRGAGVARQPERFNLAEAEEEEEEAAEDDETLNDALHPRPRPLPPSAPALGSLLRLSAAATVPRRASAVRAPASPTQSRFRAAPEFPAAPSGFTQQTPLYDIYYAYDPRP